MFKNSPRSHLASFAWDLWCTISLIGIWPRFIEPRIVSTKKITLPLATLPKKLSGITLLHISDLHFSKETSDYFLNKILKKISQLQPDCIVFTGDLLCYGELEEGEDTARLKKWLTNLQAPLGVFATLGNHDYEQYLSLDDQNRFIIEHDRISPLYRGFSKLLGFKLPRHTEPVSSPIQPLPSLINLYKETGIQVLHNEHIALGTGSSRINLVGLGDIMAEQCLPEKAFKDISQLVPTIVLSHNPDSFPRLKLFPGDLYLFGHTHGGQVNIPLFWKKITPLLDKSLKSGLHMRDNKILSISRGLGSTFRFRWFAPPQITLFTLVPSTHVPERVWQPLKSLPQVLSKQVQCPTRNQTPTD